MAEPEYCGSNLWYGNFIKFITPDHYSRICEAQWYILLGFWRCFGLFFLFGLTYLLYAHLALCARAVAAEFNELLPAFKTKWNVPQPSIDVLGTTKSTIRAGVWREKQGCLHIIVVGSNWACAFA